jgi:hypothetical protein
MFGRGFGISGHSSTKDEMRRDEIWKLAGRDEKLTDLAERVKANEINEAEQQCGACSALSNTTKRNEQLE